MNHQKIALVTGASRGLGIVISKLLIGKGCKVIGIARSVDGLQQLQEEVGREDFQYYLCDLSNIEGLPFLIDQIKSDGYINMAMVSRMIFTFLHFKKPHLPRIRHWPMSYTGR